MIEDTGERVIPKMMDPMNPLLLEHIARYQFALPYLRGRVLDLSCGSGYGSHMIAKRRKREVEEVIGIDLDPDIIKYAKGEYYHPKTQFIEANAIDETLIDRVGTFDAIVSFETIEHIAEEQALLDNYYRLLKPGGKLIVSTPFGQGRGKPCGSPFHVHQLTEQEFKALFTNYSNSQFFYQDGVLIEPKRENVRYPLGIAVCTK
ncbi:2-polyprenyl-3-methyl-5-hydroxy-6-metoxy-1,4-benzoquinol methylase [Alkalibacillus filiformis]|uniref:2-polyprenyl-3-methyl-5-hydroxy-6-metoxy-1, 4-benzoquinol methylase n=1 Tax=Alkalibacillus filiformis TaxID=200990 RepID=A0ABU0DWX4_9BACI|nr:class I SAM-dependent methyltransferase [Alkalibacillus filiformis]MDQ0352964.1 2-polyprenyl-3-methyl-5-hydroxy-6-metoxy-1,4-benzoquinol methylase [Alkalibacillus filiformis]